MFGLTSLGVIHTAISLVAVIAAVIAFARSGLIDPATAAGKTYVIATILTCVTGFGIFAHGGFGKPHVLGILTLLVLGVAWLARSDRVFGRSSAAVEVVSFSLTFFFHMIPGITETTTRLPLGSPLFASPEAPELKAITGGVFLLFLIGATFQVRRLKRDGHRAFAARA